MSHLDRKGCASVSCFLCRQGVSFSSIAIFRLNYFNTNIGLILFLRSPASTSGPPPMIGAASSCESKKEPAKTAFSNSNASGMATRPTRASNSAPGWWCCVSRWQPISGHFSKQKPFRSQRPENAAAGAVGSSRLDRPTAGCHSLGMARRSAGRERSAPWEQESTERSPP